MSAYQAISVLLYLFVLRTLQSVQLPQTRYSLSDSLPALLLTCSRCLSECNDRCARATPLRLSARETPSL